MNAGAGAPATGLEHAPRRPFPHWIMTERVFQNPPSSAKIVIKGAATMEDEWGNDPSVRRMRRVFAAIEARQARLLDGLKVHRFDKRLGQWRKMALHLFEQRSAGAARAGVGLTEKDLADLYIYCLAKVLSTRGITVPKVALPDNAAVAVLVEDRQ